MLSYAALCRQESVFPDLTGMTENPSKGASTTLAQLRYNPTI
jgi:hypothetical protein